MIQEMQIPKSSSLKILNNFNTSPPFRLYEVFNHLSTTPSIRQGLAAYISFCDKCPFIDGYVESLLATQFKREGVHVNAAKVQPLKRVKTDGIKGYLDLCFYSCLFLYTLLFFRVHERLTTMPLPFPPLFSIVLSNCSKKIRKLERIAVCVYYTRLRYW